ncbi:flagellar biosynthesis protein FlhF [Pseudomonas aeruginosa]|uniref:Flagellar biosynthesis protein FlhF n=1 Tax=Pseudomonas aeruginosa (strain ATCC 29260 / BCRC 12902 / CIP 102967 / NCIMB 11965 / PA103) TaxID=1081927 RepID=A0A022NWA8_PSEA1|nr:flagellar biosynthesis protein FlhF [Pseudomonas aeruginosa]AIC06947.1 FlhF [Pseudomonas aeruginosa PA103]AKG00268.1 flagellar biosynthesis regulator FlhF [Pseudomonas aeruginosa]AWZ83315.1 flagellar biosynthesis protein FlhF [Pseudomonas aeruginosa]EIU3315325.1 flagellar biosynthesis protein FlhF [Pseudomonas aeruginosa]EIU6859489.1 flagellar biosynthesis protein FlhF [Pseudomonas aeruginosa]
MQVKRFFAADMRQAMKLVRDELGPDAAILGNRRVAGGIELTAALDYQAPPAPSKPNPALEVELRKTQARIAEARAELTARPAENQRKDRQLFAEEKPARPSLAESMAAQAKPQAGGQTLEAMRFELNGLRELIEVQLGSIAWGQLQHQRPQQANLWRRLQRMGLPAELSKPLLERVAAVGDTRQAWRMLLAHLSRAVQTPEQDPLDAGGVLALVGPAGAGKTTTLAKMAARYVLKYGAQSLALVSMDSYRIGAQEQIKTLGRILNVPVTLVDPGQSLIQALAPLARKRMVLIDTAGLPASDPALRMQLEALASPSLNVKNYLVMATTSQSQVLKSAYQTYRHCGLAGCILTKLDEAGSLGESMALAIAQRLPVAYLADGPRIPDDLQVARSHQLVSRAVSLQALEEPSEDAMAELFAGLYQQPARRAG